MGEVTGTADAGFICASFFKVLVFWRGDLKVMLTECYGPLFYMAVFAERRIRVVSHPEEAVCAVAVNIFPIAFTGYLGVPLMRIMAGTARNIASYHLVSHAVKEGEGGKLYPFFRIQDCKIRVAPYAIICNGDIYV